MTRTADHLYDEFTRDWEAAMRPCVHCLLERCRPDERDDLAARVDAYLTVAPTPPYSDAQLARLREHVRGIVERQSL